MPRPARQPGFPTTEILGNDSEHAHSDGRRRKGERRRRLLLDATMRVIERGGVAAVSQRAVAREAQLPPSAVTYYFPTVHELLSATLARCNDDYIRRLDELDSHPRERALWLFAHDIAQYAATDRSRLFAEFDLFLLAARQPDLRSEVNRWTMAVDRLVARFVTDPARRDGAGAAVDGLLLRALWSDPVPSRDQMHRSLRELLR